MKSASRPAQPVTEPAPTPPWVARAQEVSAMATDPAPMVQVPPLSVAEWGLLRSTLHTAGLVHQSVSVGPVGGVLRVDDLPEPFRSVYRKVCDAVRAE